LTASDLTTASTIQTSHELINNTNLWKSLRQAKFRKWNKKNLRYILIIMFPGYDPYSEDTGAGSGKDASTMLLDYITPDLPGCTRIDHFRENKCPCG
jgi:hypothetical protein